MSTELHFLIRRNLDGTYTATTGPVPWQQAQTVVEMLRPTRVEYLVRSVDDPRWSHLLRFHKGKNAFRAAAKDAGESAGLKGGPGGVVRDSSEQYVTQGWQSYGYRYSRVAYVANADPKLRGAWALRTGTDPNAVAAA